MTNQPTITNFRQADEFLGRKTNRPLHGRATRIRREGDVIIIRQHNTDIITYFPDGSTLLNTGGWRTVTTKQRMNEYTPAWFAVWQNKGVWTYNIHADEGNDRIHGLFRDGLVVHLDRSVHIPEPQPDRPEVSRKALGKFAGKAARAFRDGTLPKPGPGDCWFCFLQDSSGSAMGDATGQHAHLAEHIREGYVVPSLVYRAVVEYGPGHFSGFDWENLHRWLNGQPYPVDRFATSIIKYTAQRVRAAIIDYFMHRFEFVE